MTFRNKLLDWYDRNRRDLPWRRTADPYAVWVSEAMLQQTQVQTVVPYWTRWMSRFPTVGALAEAQDEEALAVWQGLGYYRRCRMLVAGARYAAVHGMPTSHAEWLKVPGVGAYTAAAISSIANGEAVHLVDGNVERVYARICEDRAEGADLRRSAWRWAQDHLDPERPGDWNQALMELGATICRPARPECGRCPIRDHCQAFAHQTTDQVPTPKRPTVTLAICQFVWVPHAGGLFGVRQIEKGKWWHGMWEFPREDDPAVLESLLPSTSVRPIGQVRHAVTRHRITLEVALAKPSTQVPDLRWLTLTELDSLPMPAPQRKCLALAQGALNSLDL